MYQEPRRSLKDFKDVLGTLKDFKEVLKVSKGCPMTEGGFTVVIA